MHRPTRGRFPARRRPGISGHLLLGALLVCTGVQWASPATAQPGKRPAGPVPVAASQAPAPAAISRAPASADASLATAPDTATPDAIALGPEAALRALALIGVPYRWGGARPATGLDCSGLVHHVFGEIGVDTPRDTRGLSRAGSTVSRKKLQPGDLVFFNTRRRAYSHVGIYLGGDRFVHAPSAGAEVRIESMKVAYWRTRYNGARRLVPVGNAVPAPATSLAATVPEPRESPVAAASRREAAPGNPVIAADANSASRAAMAQAEDIASYYRY